MLTMCIENTAFYVNLSVDDGLGPISDNTKCDSIRRLRHLDIYIVAAGPELEKIREQFQNIPMTNHNEVHWHGETARFIFDNLVF